MNRTNTSIENDILRVFRLQQANQKRLRESTASDRIEKLGRLLNAVETRADGLKQALFEDLRKPEAEVLLTEIYPVIAEIKHARRHLKRWLRPRSVPAPLALLGSRSEIRYAPKGVVLVISPWNFPFQLALSPLVSAIAAGNAVILKPS